MSGMSGGRCDVTVNGRCILCVVRAYHTTHRSGSSNIKSQVGWRSPIGYPINHSSRQWSRQCRIRVSRASRATSENPSATRAGKKKKKKKKKKNPNSDTPYVRIRKRHVRKSHECHYMCMRMHDVGCAMTVHNMACGLTCFFQNIDLEIHFPVIFMICWSSHMKSCFISNSDMLSVFW